MLCYLINPCNPSASFKTGKENGLTKYRIWKPLGLIVLASLTPREWQIKIIDENLKTPDYSLLPPPDLVGITAFTSQAPRAYEIASEFRSRGIPVIMGGIHATMQTAEAAERVDAVVTGEAEDIWPRVLTDFVNGNLQKIYHGTPVAMDKIPPARHDLLSEGYMVGSIQTTRGCPLDCKFCSVTAFNGKKYRHRPIENIIDELKIIKEPNVLIVDDNLIGTNKKHIERAKNLFRAIINAGIKKKFIAQASINVFNDEEFLKIASKAGLMGIFIGFETLTDEGLVEIEKKYNIRRKGNIREGIKKMHKYGIVAAGSFIMGLDVDKKGVGATIAQAGLYYDIDILNLLFLTPLPGTRLWDEFQAENRIAAGNFPEDWQYYTLKLPVANYYNLSWNDLSKELVSCYEKFYSILNVTKRFLKILFIDRKPFNAFYTLVANIGYRRVKFIDQRLFGTMDLSNSISYVDKVAQPNVIV